MSLLDKKRSLIDSVPNNPPDQSGKAIGPENTSDTEDIEAARTPDNVAIVSQIKPTAPHHKQPGEAGGDATPKWKKNLEYIAAVIGFGLLVVNFFQLHSARIAADAAKSAADTAGKQLELSERPWITLTPVLSGPFVIDKSGATIDLKIYMRNVGHSPAGSVNLDVEGFASAPRDPRVSTARDALCSRLQSNSPSHSGATVFPDIFPGADSKEPSISWNITLSQKEIDAGFPATDGVKWVLPYIVGCVDYRSEISDQHYFTGFVYAVTEKGKVINFGNGNVPLARISLNAPIMPEIPAVIAK